MSDVQSRETQMERIEAERPEVGQVIENNSAKRADNADFSCQHRACQRILRPGDFDA